MWIIRGAGFSLLIAVSVQAAIAQTNPPTQPAQTNPPTQAEVIAAPAITLIQAGLLVVALAACIACLWMVFFFGRRLQTSAYLRDTLVSAAKQEQLRNLLRELDERRRVGPLDPSHPPPEGFEPEMRALWADLAGDRAVAASAAPWPMDESREERERRLADQQRAENERLAPFREWAKAERERYIEARRQAEQQAQQRAETMIPSSMDISLLGGGWTFLLEFSTVIVILFVLLCLGVLGTVTGKDIITVLASIAGYVLGKATASAQKTPDKEASPQPPK